MDPLLQSANAPAGSVRLGPFVSSRSAESPAATPAPHPAAEGGRAAVPLRVGAAVRALWGDG